MADIQKAIQKIDGFLKSTSGRKRKNQVQDQQPIAMEGDSSDNDIGDADDAVEWKPNYTVGEVTYLGGRGIGMRWFANENLTSLTFGRFITINNGKMIKQPNSPSV